VTGAAALGALVPAIVALLYAKRGEILARGASRQAQGAAEVASAAGTSAQAAHDRLDALSPPAPPAAGPALHP
jgi:hypothetical protein